MGKITLVAGVVMALGVSMAQDSVIYRGFAELNQPQTFPAGGWTWEPTEELFGSLVQGTLRLNGVDERSRVYSAPAYSNPINAYQGKTVFFFWEKKWREATLVSAEHNLYLYEGKYMVGLPGQIAYPDASGFEKPKRNSVKFAYEGSGNGTISYLTRGISWNLRYTLDDGKLRGWATLSNDIGKTVNLGKTELVAGSVPLMEGGFNIPSPAPEAAEDAMAMSAPVAKRFVGASYAGEAGGLYRYSLPENVSLEPGLTDLPFIEAEVKPVFTWKYQSYFNTAKTLQFQRGYRFVAPENLAGGIVNIRDQGFFVGQAGVSDTAKGEDVEVSLGVDPAGIAKRTVEGILKNKFKVTTDLTNPKTYAVEVEMMESMPQPFVLEMDGVEKLPEGYRNMFVLAPGQTKTIVYTVTFPNQK